MSHTKAVQGARVDRLLIPSHHPLKTKATLGTREMMDLPVMALEPDMEGEEPEVKRVVSLTKIKIPETGKMGAQVSTVAVAAAAVAEQPFTILLPLVGGAAHFMVLVVGVEQGLQDRST